MCRAGFDKRARELDILWKIGLSSVDSYVQQCDREAKDSIEGYRIETDRKIKYLEASLEDAKDIIKRMEGKYSEKIKILEKQLDESNHKCYNIEKKHFDLLEEQRKTVENVKKKGGFTELELSSQLLSVQLERMEAIYKMKEQAIYEELPRAINIATRKNFYFHDKSTQTDLTPGTSCKIQYDYPLQNNTSARNILFDYLVSHPMESFLARDVEFKKTIDKMDYASLFSEFILGCNHLSAVDPSKQLLGFLHAKINTMNRQNPENTDIKPFIGSTQISGQPTVGGSQTQQVPGHSFISSPSKQSPSPVNKSSSTRPPLLFTFDRPTSSTPLISVLTRTLTRMIQYFQSTHTSQQAHSLSTVSIASALVQSAGYTLGRSPPPLGLDVLFHSIMGTGGERSLSPIEYANIVYTKNILSEYIQGIQGRYTHSIHMHTYIAKTDIVELSKLVGSTRMELSLDDIIGELCYLQVKSIIMGGLMDSVDKEDIGNDHLILFLALKLDQKGYTDILKLFVSSFTSLDKNNYGVIEIGDLHRLLEETFKMPPREFSRYYKIWFEPYEVHRVVFDYYNFLYNFVKAFFRGNVDPALRNPEITLLDLLLMKVRFVKKTTWVDKLRVRKYVIDNLTSIDLDGFAMLIYSRTFDQCDDNQKSEVVDTIRACRRGIEYKANSSKNLQFSSLPAEDQALISECLAEWVCANTNHHLLPKVFERPSLGSYK